MGDRSADPDVHCLPTIRQLQPALCSILSRKFRRVRVAVLDRQIVPKVRFLAVPQTEFRELEVLVRFHGTRVQTLRAYSIPVRTILQPQGPHSPPSFFGVRASQPSNHQPQVSSRWEWHNGKGQPVRGFGFGVRDTVIRALGCTGLLCLFFGPSVESLPAYSVHMGVRSAGPSLHCLSTTQPLQPVKPWVCGRKFLWCLEDVNCLNHPRWY